MKFLNIKQKQQAVKIDNKSYLHSIMETNRISAPSSSAESSKVDTPEVSTVQLPSKFAQCSRTDLAILISRMLTFLIEMNDSSNASHSFDTANSVSGLTRFHSRIPPEISVYDYLLRLTKYSSLEHCVLLSAVYYIDLLSSVYPTFTLNSLTVHRFLLTATTVASKGLCDSFCTNTHYAKVGGVHSSELNILEREFLKRVNYRILPRDDNLAWCKMESKQHVFTLDNDVQAASSATSLNPAVSHDNGGYNTLDIYYHKIVKLVGSYNSSPDKSKAVNYALPHLMEKSNKQAENVNINTNIIINTNHNDTSVLPHRSINTLNCKYKKPSHSRKRNLDTAKHTEFDDTSITTNSIAESTADDDSSSKNDHGSYHQDSCFQHSTSKKHINEQRMPKITHNSDH